MSKQKNEDYLFKEILYSWLEVNRLRYKGSTERKYRYLIETHIIPKLGNVEISSLSAIKINSFLEEKMKEGRIDKNGGLSASYVRSIMLIINSAMKYAVNEELCLPLKTPIYKPVSASKKMKILKLSEQKELENYLFNHINNTNIGILLSLYAGLRIGEVCALSWCDVDLTENIIHVRSTVTRENADNSTYSRLCISSPKTCASIRDIPISASIKPLLVTLRENSPSPYVISSKATFLSPRTYEYRYHRILENCGLPNINYHALRHTFATRCIEAGVDVKSLSEILGHANVSITLNTYVHSSMEFKASQIEKLSQFLS